MIAQGNTKKNLKKKVLMEAGIGRTNLAQASIASTQ
jgi:hypothetical protein